MISKKLIQEKLNNCYEGRLIIDFQNQSVKGYGKAKDFKEKRRVEQWIIRLVKKF